MNKKRERWSDDLMWSLKCAIDDAQDYDGLHEDALREALAEHGIAVVPLDRAQSANPAAMLAALARATGA